MGWEPSPPSELLPSFQQCPVLGLALTGSQMAVTLHRVSWMYLTACFLYPLLTQEIITSTGPLKIGPQIYINYQSSGVHDNVTSLLQVIWKLIFKLIVEIKPSPIVSTIWYDAPVLPEGKLCSMVGCLIALGPAPNHARYVESTILRRGKGDAGCKIWYSATCASGANISHLLYRTGCYRDRTYRVLK